MLNILLIKVLFQLLYSTLRPFSFFFHLSSPFYTLLFVSTLSFSPPSPPPPPAPPSLLLLFSSVTSSFSFSSPLSPPPPPPPSPPPPLPPLCHLLLIYTFIACHLSFPVIVWDDLKKEKVAELDFLTDVLAVKLRRDR